MKYYGRKHYINFYEFEHSYDLKNLKDYYDFAAREIERLEESIKLIKEYQMDLYEHSQKVLNTEFKKFVVINRMTNWSNKKVEYLVYLDNRPMIDNKRIVGNHSHNKRFEGIERHEAKKYALELAKKYNATIEQTGGAKLVKC